MSAVRKSKFFLDPEEAKAFGERLRAYGHKDVLVVLKKNIEDCVRGSWATARIDGANVHWTPGPLRYNHACTIGFEIISETGDGTDITPAMIKTALLKRIESLDGSHSQEWLKAMGCPYDSFFVEDPSGAVPEDRN